MCSVHLCSSVRNRTLPLYDTTHKQHAGEFFLSQSAQSSLSIFAHSFEATEGLRHTEFTERYCQRWLQGSVKSVDLMSLWNTVCSVLLCKSVRKRRHPRYEIRPMRLAADFFLSQNSQI